jgi:hypothetical protein
MASPVFDKEQYELRGHLPTPMTEAQRTALNLAISRVNGQVDWNAQLLGFSGPNYWGSRIATTDGSYKWKGLPETVSEKRAVQVGAFGVYNKDKEYSQRPAPYNRSEVRASADSTFDIFEENDQTRVVPFGQPREILYEQTPRLITGGEYIFNALVDVESNTGATEWLYVVQDLDQKITSVRLLGEGTESQAISVRIKDSLASPFLFFLESWRDISDWTSQQVLDQYVGVWGNKGSSVAAHFVFDALDIHGFNEEEGLSLDNVLESITIAGLLELVGLVPGPATPRTVDHYNFYIGDCDDFYQPTVSLETKIVRIQTENYEAILTENGFEISEDDGACSILDPTGIILETDGPDEPTSIIDNGTFEDAIPPVDSLNNGEYPGTSSSTVSDDGVFGQQPAELFTESFDALAINDPSYDNSACYLPPDPEFGICDTPNYTLTLRQFFDSDPSLISTDPGPETSNALGCNGVQFLFPPTCFIDNAEYPAVLGQFYLDGGDYDFPVIPTNSVGDGLYDRDPFSVCDGLPEDYERIIESDDLIVDVAGEAGPILMSDPGADNETVLIASGGEYDGDEIAFDGLELETVSFEYEPKTTYGETRFPCVEWVFDPSLDNSTYFPVAAEAAWMGTDDGEYDRRRSSIEIASQGDIPCVGNLTFVGGFLSFDDGVFDEIVAPNCDFVDLTPPNCDVVDGQLYQPGINPLVPPLSNTECGSECGTVDNGPYLYGQAQDTEAVIDEGSLDTCVIYDNTEYDLVQPFPGVDCIAYNNGSYAGGNLPFPIDCVVSDQNNFIGGPYSPPAIDDGFYTTQTIVEILILATESGLELITEGDDLLGYDPAFITPITVPSNCTPCSTDGPVPIVVDCTLDNGDFESPSPPTADANDGFYDRDLDPFCVPCQDPNSLVIPCPVEMLRVRLDQLIFSAPRWRMCPSVMNSLTPLRLWKNRVLNVPDIEIDNVYVNSLVADENSGPESPRSYRHFARLPVDYSRNSKFWNRTQAVLANESYFSRALPTSQTQLPVLDQKPLLYDEVYSIDPDLIRDDAVFYVEDYLVSTVVNGDGIKEDGFESALEAFEAPSASLPYVGATIINYDAYESRLLNGDGTRVGNYLKWNRRDKDLTGFLAVDIEDFALRYTGASEPVVSDASRTLIPNVEFPDDPDEASFSNYAVSYAYFVADMSAGDDPVFDPKSFFCHRSKSIDNVQRIVDELATQENIPILTEDYQFLDPFGIERLENSPVNTNTRYILHN